MTRRRVWILRAAVVWNGLAALASLASSVLDFSQGLPRVGALMAVAAVVEAGIAVLVWRALVIARRIVHSAGAPARTRSVQCPGCDRTAVVEMPEVAPGVLDRQNLVCADCGLTLNDMEPRRYGYPVGG